VLVIAGQTLHECLRASDFSGRYGSDEFVAILSNSGVESAVAERFRSDLQQRFRSESSGISDLRITATVGKP
jgi:diguanylate cyclase (GGDEF)-like protein